jgi:6-pyruvoyl-tetrahydropterin synthase
MERGYNYFSLNSLQFFISLVPKSINLVCILELSNIFSGSGNKMFGCAGNKSPQYGLKRNKKILYVAPPEAILIMKYNHTNIDNSIILELEEIIANNFKDNNLFKNGHFKLNVFLRREEEKIQFGYTHGLKKHKGNCQRLLHGHRNTLEVYDEIGRNENLERALAMDFFGGNIHFAYAQNIINKNNFKELENKNYLGKISDFKNNCDVEISYESSQGYFYLSIPAQDVFVLPVDTTVENLAHYFLLAIRNADQSNMALRVVAYEGIQKGSDFIQRF